MEFFSKTDIGKVRKTNQDAVTGEIYSPQLGWAVVCDGMGGTTGGDVASHTAVNEVKNYLRKHLKEVSNPEDIENIMEKAVQKANSAIFKKSQIDKLLQRMGTTMVLCVIYRDTLYVSHVGDSRVYILSSSELNQISIDHSVVQEMISSGEITREEAKSHPQKNIITRALGIDKILKVDHKQVKISKGDLIIMCTDGLINHLEEPEIFEICSQNNIKNAVNYMIKEVNKRGASDNVTIGIININQALSEK